MIRARAGALILLLLSAGPPAQAQHRAAPAGEWPMPAKDYASTRYSELAQITPGNGGCVGGMPRYPL